MCSLRSGVWSRGPLHRQRLWRLCGNRWEGVAQLCCRFSAFKESRTHSPPIRSLSCVSVKKYFSLLLRLVFFFFRSGVRGRRPLHRQRLRRLCGNRCEGVAQLPCRFSAFNESRTHSSPLRSLSRVSVKIYFSLLFCLVFFFFLKKNHSCGYLRAME